LFCGGSLESTNINGRILITFAFFNLVFAVNEVVDLSSEFYGLPKSSLSRVAARGWIDI